MRILTPLRDPSVALLWGGLSFSAIGDQIYAVALTWIAVGVLGAATGYLSALGAGCVLATALVAGRWADAWSERVAMIGADLLRALALIAFVLDWSIRGQPTTAVLVLATVVLAIGHAVFRPALQGLLPSLVSDPVRLPAANALLDSTARIARLLGPGLVTIFVAWVPTRHFLSLDAASFLLSAASLLLIGQMRPSYRSRDDGPPRNVLASALHGFRAVAGHPLLRMHLQVTGIINGVWYAVIFLGLPLAIARNVPGNLGLGGYGLVISAYGCTNLASTLIIGNRKMPRNPGPIMFAGHVVLGAGFLMMALAAIASLPPAMTVAAFAAGAAVGAVGGPMHDIPVAVLRQTELPRADIPAATRAYLIATNGGVLVTMLLAPSLYAVLPVACVIAFCGLVTIGIGVAGIVRFAASPVRTDPL
ncbi:MFS transporter [Acidisphaera sp. S103]|uniref:MFS transporter n=1 Tax=Acidisphaera sp. S103 TaxID=1747223 RepID=UPI00131D286E|nr:MFS transporter [Acidisphaera sp. S103]